MARRLSPSHSARARARRELARRNQAQVVHADDPEGTALDIQIEGLVKSLCALKGVPTARSAACAASVRSTLSQTIRDHGSSG